MFLCFRCLSGVAWVFVGASNVLLDTESYFPENSRKKLVDLFLINLCFQMKAVKMCFGVCVTRAFSENQNTFMYDFFSSSSHMQDPWILHL